jgi:microcystin-dependent protein
MADAFVAEIRIFPFNFAPRGWALCDGQLLSISQNTALFALLGTTYGGDGRVTFGLPNLQGSVPVHAGSSGGPGLQQWFTGESQGTEAVTLLTTEMPLHPHAFNGKNDVGSSPAPSGLFPAQGGWDDGTNAGVVAAYTTNAPNVQMDQQHALTLTGGSQPHNNMMSYLTLNFCIAMQGIFPARP